MRVLFWIVCAVIGLQLVPPARAETLPRWEFGIGPAGFSLPDYRGSDEQRGYLVPFPYFKYRGERLEIDRDGILFKTDRLKLGLSVAVAPGVDSDDNDARIGMPDLDPVLQLGPVLEVMLWRDPERHRRVSLALPFRGVFAVDGSDFDRIGTLFSPNLKFEFDSRESPGWDVTTAIGPIYATEKYHDYYYEVTPAFARLGRPTFDAESGYGGVRLTFVATKRFPQYWLGAFARYDDLSGAKFGDSPLVKRDYAVMAGVGIAWIVAKSKHASTQR
jgi:outer membrane scaffolding protein for murein synthesis (MipA/OmpV family)